MRSAGEAHWALISGELRWSLLDGDARTSYRRSRRARMRGRFPRLLPDVKEGDGWRASGDEVLRVSSGELGWLQNKARKRVRGMRQVEGICLEE
jgi:hypothetical protein